jgi:ACS family D-galactonate transporter-like MFS transporter
VTLATEPRSRKLAWIALWLLVISVCINYADRGNLGVAAKSLQNELNLNPDQLGKLLGAFSLTYAFSLIAAGKLIDRFNVNWLYAGAFLLWSMATGATGLATGFWSILILRLLLGASESIAYPAYSKMIVTSFPEKLRGTANGLIDAGSKLGPAVGVFLGVKMLGWFTWRGMFLIMGAASLLWLVPWAAIAGKLPGSTEHRAAAPQAESYLRIASTRGLWGTAIGLFGGNYAWYFLLNWLPYYFETVRHYQHNRLAVLASIPFWAIAISSTCFGLLADYFIHRGHEAGRLRQWFVCLGLSGCCILMFSAIEVQNELRSNILLVLAFVAMGAWSSNHWAFSQFLAGPANAGKWTGLQNCIGNFAGVLGPWLSGYTVQVTHSFFAAFAIASGFALMAVFSYWFLVGKPAQIFGNTATSWPPTIIETPADELRR